MTAQISDKLEWNDTEWSISTIENKWPFTPKKAFGLEPERGFGWLVPGAPADLIVLDYDGATPLNAGALAWHLAFGLGSRHVRDVVVAGEVVLRARVPQKVDASAVRERSHAAAERLWARMAEL